MFAVVLLAALHTGAGAPQAGSGAFAFQGATGGRAQEDALRGQAESLLAAHDLPAARALAERLDDHHPNDARTLMLLGRILLVWPTFGRFQAETLFTRASRLLPDDPEPLYWLGQVGLALGGDDGEQIARRGLVPVLGLNPDYRDAWALWSRLYRGERERRDAIRALERHAGSWNADYRRAQLLAEQGSLARAASLFDSLAHARPADPAPRARLAQALFLMNRDAEATAAYEAALARAAADTGGVLWGQVRGIASVEERRAWAATTPDDRAAFLRRFWAGREPDLATPVNERFGQHFRRLADAKRLFGLLHPNARYWRSPLFRALSGGVGGMPGGLEGAEQRALLAQCTARLPSARDSAAQAGMGPRVEADTATQTPNMDDRLDDRGRIYLRHGRPTWRFVGSLGDETWCYVEHDGSVRRVTFVRRTGGYGVSGDMVVTPLAAGEAESASQLLVTDRYDAVPELAFAFWPAAFRAADRQRTELLVIPDSLRGIAVLVDGEGREAARDSGTGHALRLIAPPGSYLLLFDGARAGRLGRYRGSITLPDYGGDLPAVSGLLLAAGDVPPARDTLATRAPQGLVLPVDRPLRVYAELYNMGRRDGDAVYDAEYRFERLDGGIALRGRGERVTTITLERRHAFEPRLVESVVVDPGRLPPGHYRLALRVTDRVRGVDAASATIEFHLR